MSRHLAQFALAFAALAPTALADDTAIVVTPSWVSLSVPEIVEFGATHCDVAFEPDWSSDGGASGFLTDLGGGDAIFSVHAFGEEVVTASDPDSLLDDAEVTVRGMSIGSMAITAARFRDSDDPAKTRLTVRGFVDTGVLGNSLGDQYPFRFEESDTSAIVLNGLSSGAVVELPSKGKVRRFTSVEGDTRMKLVPTKAPTRWRFVLRADKFPLDPDAELSVLFDHTSLFRFVGEVTLTDGRFSSRKQAAAIGAPDLVVLTGRGTFPDDGDDTLKLVVAATTLTDTPEVPEDVTIELGGISLTVPAESFDVKGTRWVATGGDDGVKRMVVDTKRQRVTLRVAGTELGTWFEGFTSSTLRLDVGDRARKIGVVVDFDGKQLTL